MRPSLVELYRKHAGKVSDKWISYLHIYEKIFEEFRDRRINILEIGYKMAEV